MVLIKRQVIILTCRMPKTQCNKGSAKMLIQADYPYFDEYRMLSKA
ncbi:hypothetical protein THIOSC15_2880017 [uncultured Thiomicrorhabdus sp.]